MKINIYGSTGEIGKKTLDIILKYFPHINVNLLCANSNIKTLLRQIKLHKPKFVYLNDKKSSLELKKKIRDKVIILSYKDLKDYLKSSNSSLSILAISGYKSLYYLEDIVYNTDNLGIVSKEAIVSAGHIFKKKNYFKKTNIFPIDSEHYSLYEYFNTSNKNLDIKKIIITASGGPFYKKKFKDLKNIKFNQAIKHPKWKMGYKNSIDSATLVNKCLEVIEAHYLFDISFDKIDVLVHPEALVHSIIEKNNYILNMNLFKNDMSIPIYNFLNSPKKTTTVSENNYFINEYKNLNFIKVKNENFPIYNFFKNLDKSNPSNLIKFNVGNEYAVNMFKKNSIKYTDIYKIIKKVCSLNLYSELNNIKDIIIYHEDIEKKIRSLF